jgi:hypothetical protein
MRGLCWLAESSGTEHPENSSLKKALKGGSACFHPPICYPLHRIDSLEKIGRKLADKPDGMIG